ncbi:ribonuclease H-like domain-containing protein [Tanacetum coccineum]|uniref:Ribonuclease H-like domain-containing protein n=1 Tax=Tanacetum coccineum TaxID=301880 RepID=A0ABQ5CRS9_9ASTR
MTDLGPLNYFIGVSAQRSTNCNPFRTPIDTDSKLGFNGDHVSDSTLYRSLVGALQYFTFTRTDLSYVIHQATLSRSSAEAEYRGVANVFAETTCSSNLVCELHAPVFTPLCLELVSIRTVCAD